MQTQVLFVLPEAVEGEWTGPADPGATEGLERQRQIARMSVPGTVPNPYGPAVRREVDEGLKSDRPNAAPARLKSQINGGLRVAGTGLASGYEGNLIGRIQAYADRCVYMVKDEPFDVVHAHDWVTFPAGMAISARTGIPLVAHVHSTEFDRSGEFVNKPVYDIEWAGMRAARAVITVSHLTKRTVVDRYGLPSAKVHVIHNGIVPADGAPREKTAGDGKSVLFLGRITMQKGPEYFVRAAAAVLERVRGVKFVMAGWGDLAPRIVEQVAAMGLGGSVLFAGFLRGRDVARAYRMADVYVMPSVSEPFGLTALEAIQHGVPVILSRNSGAAEVLQRGALKIDFWDVRDMADKIIAVLRSPALADTLRQHATEEVAALTWEAAAMKCRKVYAEVACA
jgi:glycogen(starch) synthase